MKTTLLAWSSALLLLGPAVALSVVQRMPPPRTYIGGDFPGGDPWLPDNPTGGGAGGGGWDWYGDNDFWGGNGSRWWHYPDGTPGGGSGGGGGNGGNGENSGSGGCNSYKTKRAVTNCMIEVQTGAYVNLCACWQKTRNGQPIDCGKCLMTSADPEMYIVCDGKSIRDECVD